MIQYVRGEAKAFPRQTIVVPYEQVQGMIQQLQDMEEVTRTLVEDKLKAEVEAREIAAEANELRKENSKLIVRVEELEDTYSDRG